jgi:hypothetical protein
MTMTIRDPASHKLGLHGVNQLGQVLRRLVRALAHVAVSHAEQPADAGR